MHVMVIPADRGGCGYYRLIWPGQAVSLVRPDWTVSIFDPKKVEAGFVDNKFVGVRGFPDPLPDVLVMQRVGTRGQLETLRWAREQGIATVVDFDDAMWCIDRGNAAWRSWNLDNPTGQHWRACNEAAKVADLVTCTTDSLAKYYGKHHARTEVIPNCIPKAATLLPGTDDNEVFTAGWSGFALTHPGDCKVSKPAADAVLEAGGNLRVIADAPGAAKEWVVPVEMVDSIEPQPLGPDYYTALSRLDLMLVGLKSTPFNQAKSSLKVLEAAALGVPSIAADTRPHRDLAKTGFPVTLASNPSEWADAAKQAAMADRDEWLERCADVWSAVVDGWTIEGNAEWWAQAWERAYRRANP